jgi:hypothetical protein
MGDWNGSFNPLTKKKEIAGAVEGYKESSG